MTVGLGLGAESLPYAVSGGPMPHEKTVPAGNGGVKPRSGFGAREGGEGGELGRPICWCEPRGGPSVAEGSGAAVAGDME